MKKFGERFSYVRLTDANLRSRRKQLGCVGRSKCLDLVGCERLA